jgi:hypothetical protein
MEELPEGSKAVTRIVSVNTYAVSMMVCVDLVKSKRPENGAEDMESNQRGERGRLERDEGESAQPRPESWIIYTVRSNQLFF